MSRVFFTADTHFGHANVIRHSGRPFASIEEHDEALIENWNSVVTYKDTVYHLGDFAWRDALRYWERVNGSICLIRGNHEGAAEKIKHKFMWFKDVHMIKVGEQSIWLSHYSHEVWSRSHHGAWHLYGHSHNSLRANMNRRSMDVGVDAVAARMSGLQQGIRIQPGMTRPEHYMPIPFEDVEQVMRARDWVPIDHHGADCG